MPKFQRTDISSTDIANCTVALNVHIAIIHKTSDVMNLVQYEKTQKNVNKFSL
jgi:hypothetical protein